MAGHRLTAFDCGHKQTNSWLGGLARPSQTRLIPYALTEGPTSMGAVMLAPTGKRSALPIGYTEIVALGVDSPYHRRGFALSILVRIVEMFRQPSEAWQAHSIGLACRAQTEACELMLEKFGFVRHRRNLFTYKFHWS